MSVAGIMSSGLLSQTWQSLHAKTQNFQSELQQLGQDLQTGNLSQAQSDFSALSQTVSGSQQSNSSLSQAFGSLGSALQTGNLSAAQKAYATVQQDVVQASQAPHMHHHHMGGSSASASSSTDSTVSQLLSSLGVALQGGNISAAQAAYSTLQSDLVTLGWNSATAASSVAGAVNLVG